MAILYLLCASLLSVWCVARFIVPVEPLVEYTPPPPPAKVELLFVGDVMAHSPQVAVAKRDDGYDFTSCFKYVKPIFDSVDCVVANLETTLAEAPPYSGYPCFRAPAALATALADAGVDIAVTANNHSLDNRREGVESTLDILRKSGISAVGTTEDNVLRFSIEGVNFAIMAYTYGTNGIPVPEGVSVHKIDTVAMSRDLARAADADCRIAFLHWGTEYSRRPNRQQCELADFLHRSGCQVVIGSHPHTVQCAECAGNSITVYSLGNFISNQRMRYSDGGVMAKVTVEKDSVGCQFDLDILPVWVRKEGYVVFPQSVADTTNLNTAERAACNLFFEDTRKIFSSDF